MRSDDKQQTAMVLELLYNNSVSMAILLKNDGGEEYIHQARGIKLCIKALELSDYVVLEEFPEYWRK